MSQDQKPTASSGAVGGVLGAGGEGTPTMRRPHRTLLAAATAAGVLVAGLLAPSALAQLPPLGPREPTTTTSPPPPDDPTPEGSAPGPGPEPDGPAPGGSAPGPGPASGDGDGGGGDGGTAPRWGQVPPEAQRIIDSVPRTGPSSSKPLVEALAQLEALGVDRDEAMRVGMGRFPIAGTATYVHDWLFPRYGPGFRFHLGTDVFAPHGTPIRAPVDGVATTNTQPLGGLTVRVTMDDGTYFYLAHLSGLVDGFTNGMRVQTGDVVGYVGDSGNARGGAPHLHFGIYPQGGAPVDPKPILDQFLAEAQARLPEVIEAYRAAGYGVAPPEAPADPAPPQEEPALPDLEEPAAVADEDGLPIGLLYAAGADPAGGALRLLEAEIGALADSIDWSERIRPGTLTWASVRHRDR
jgi:murein DD-endopeptidase MepM/ murein hydrolase activator NlpD